MSKTHLKISSGLREFPREVFELSSTLEFLDLSGNELISLPEEFSKMRRLKVLFCSDNKFEIFPEVLHSLPELEMIAFKNNNMRVIPEESLPRSLRWLILTNNKLQKLPQSVGRCTEMQKLMLAGNLLSELPEEMARLHKLTLLRISSNSLQTIPAWLFSLPQLSYLGFAGNPCNVFESSNSLLPEYDWRSFNIGKLLGQGASGSIYEATSLIGEHNIVAIKVFKGHITSDGLPVDELQACMRAGSHSNLISTIGRLTGHPSGSDGLVLQLVPPTYHILGLPPSMDTCTRDCYEPGQTVSPTSLFAILRSVASAAAHLHVRNVSHGDLYAHNTLVNNVGHAVLGDLGAATCYGTGHRFKSLLERIEVRAFGYLIDDLYRLATLSQEHPDMCLLRNLRETCLVPKVETRPSFDQIYERLLHYEEALHY